MNMRVDAAGGDDHPLGGDHLRGDADDHPGRDARHHRRVTGLADARDPAVLDAEVRLVDAGPIDHHRVGDHQIECIRGGHAGGLTHAIAQHLAAAELALVAVHGVIALDPRDERRVTEPDRVARRRAVDLGVGRSIDPVTHGAPPATATRFTVRDSPGSNRTAVPAGMSSRMPIAAARSKSSAPFVSANG